MITGIFYSKPTKQSDAALVKTIDSSTAYVLPLEFPSGGRLYQPLDGICMAKVVASPDQINWNDCTPPCVGFYVSN